MQHFGKSVSSRGCHNLGVNREAAPHYGWAYVPVVQPTEHNDDVYQQKCKNSELRIESETR